MTDRDTVRDQIESALRRGGVFTHNQVANVMAIVGPIARSRDAYRDERDATQRELNQVRRDSKIGWENCHQAEDHITELYEAAGIAPETLIEDAVDALSQLRWLHAEAVWQRDETRRESGCLLGELGAAQGRLAELRAARKQRDELRARVADLEGQLARAAILPDDAGALIREAFWSVQHHGARASDQLDAVVALVESWRAEPATLPKPHNCDRYVDVHHLVEAEIQIARHLRGAACQPGAHSTTQIAKAVAWAFDMDLTAEAEHASRPVHLVREQS